MQKSSILHMSPAMLLKISEEIYLKLSKSSSKARQSIILGYLTNANTILECVLILLLHYFVPQVVFLGPAGRIHTIPNTLSRYQFSACHASETAIRTSKH